MRSLKPSPIVAAVLGATGGIGGALIHRLRGADELRRSHRDAICVALHPDTVKTPLTARFKNAGLEVQDPDIAAERLLHVIAGLTPSDSGRFFDLRGESVSW